MQMFYGIKRDIEISGDNAEIYSDFNAVKLQLSEKEDLKILDEKLKKRNLQSPPAPKRKSHGVHKCEYRGFEY